jgi:hypothetical protein
MLTGSAGLIENQVREWIRRAVCLVDKEHGRCKKFVVRHLSVDKKPTSDVHLINLPGDPAVEGTEIADKIVMEVAERAQQDANDLNSGVQTYAVYAYYTLKVDYVPRKVFRVAAEDEIERDEAGPSEPPTEKGITAQLMRHNEVVSKTAMVGMGFILQTFQKELKESREMNRTFLQQQVDMTLLIQEVLNDSSKRKIEEKQAEIQVSVIEGVFEHLKVAMPILANRLAGKEIFPPKMERELYLLASMLEGLSSEQQHMLQSMLKPEQLALLGELLGMYEERKGKFIKADGQEEEPSEPGKKTNGKINGTVPVSNKLLTMFEKRRTLVAQEKAVELEDRRTKRIEDKAAKIRGTLNKVSQSLSRNEDGEG